MDNLCGFIRYFFILCSLLLTSCLSVPEGVVPVNNFEIDRYLGRWYEVARLDHSFERDLQAVTAEYVTRDDGGIKVINSGRNIDSGEIQQAEGRAYFVEDPSKGHLKVSFFGPFFGSYVIFELDQDNYQYAFIAGNTTDYLWLLSRSPKVSKELLEQFKDSASNLGFNLEDLIMVSH
ncbi:lipocalin family protein [Porticoccaceae bacterium]|jgi:apolipoprotein D and lipocalin family protein|nr:lipocalin family protein [Porticoccaceae bacterium]